jgi:hypothetical protein
MINKTTTTISMGMKLNNDKKKKKWYNIYMVFE